MPFDPGQPVLVALFGKGVVREVRNGGRYLVDVKGRPMEVREAQLTPFDEPKGSRKAARAPIEPEVSGLRSSSHAPSTIDLHGMTVEEAEAAVDRFLNDALLAGHGELRIIHGRSGGRLRAAVHARLRACAAVQTFRLDPRNEGVTIVMT